MILCAVFLSGCAGLIYQIAWMRKLTLFLGVTSAAVGTVLAVFMAGLSLGAWLFGRYGDRVKSSLMMYAFIEIGISAFGFFSGFGLDFLQGVYVGMVRGAIVPEYCYPLIRLLFVLTALIIPTALMGATLPVVIRFFSREFKRIGFDTGIIYAVNTFGALSGTVLAVLFLVRTFGDQWFYMIH